MPLPPCAATCPAWADLIAELARAHGRPETVERVAHGLPPTTTPDAPCDACEGDPT